DTHEEGDGRPRDAGPERRGDPIRAPQAHPAGDPQDDRGDIDRRPAEDTWPAVPGEQDATGADEGGAGEHEVGDRLGRALMIAWVYRRLCCGLSHTQLE